MAFKLRKPGVIEMFVQLLFLAVLSIFVYDFVVALGQTACSDPNATHGCYPWGAEGPAADVWYYQTKVAYLSFVAETMFILTAAFLIPLLVHRRAIAWVLVGATLVVGYLQAQWIAGLLVPLIPVS